MRILARLIRPLLRAIVRYLFRVRVVGLEHAERSDEGRLIVANHVSFIDGLLLYLFLPEPPAFAINTDIARRWYIRLLLPAVRYHELDTFNPVSLKNLVRLLRDGESIVIFPEGRITTTGSLMKVYDGPGLIADKADAQILPVALDGPQYSRFSYLHGLNRLLWFPQFTISILPSRKLAIEETLKGQARRAAATETFAEIMREIAFYAAYHHETLFEALIRARRRYGRRTEILADATGARLTYQSMITRCFVLGSLIAGLTRPDERVGILLPSTAAGVVSLFACLARGRQAAMLNFTAGARGLVTALETANIRIVFTSRAFVEAGELTSEVAALGEHSEVIYLEDLRAHIKPWHKLGGLAAGLMPTTAHRLLSPTRSPEKAAVILFTSGSEGIPKGVVLSHRNLLANFAQVNTLIDLSRRDCVLNVLPIFHAFGLLGGVLLPLLKGCKSFQYPSPLHYRIIPELCYEHGVTCLFGTTTFLRGYGRSAHPYDFHRMRFVISGAEKMTEDTRQLWYEKFGIRIYEGYGATEASPVLAVNNPLASRFGTVGQLVAGVDYYVAPVEGIHEGGELVVRGPNIMQGYLFHGSGGEIIRPWTEDRGAGWYETGDIVTVDQSRYVTILGRAKRFAKIGGEMVSLAAVEEMAVYRWPEGQHAAISLGDSRKGEQIVLLTDTVDAARGDFIDAARELQLSELTIPKRVVYCASVPLLGSGKIDYAGVRELIETEDA
ncbi:MAG: AMP-binding protein [Gammaproteobacteria bacterium]